MVQNAMTPQERLAVTPVHSMMAMTKRWIGVDKQWRAGKCRLGQSLGHHVGLRGLAGEWRERLEAQADSPMMFHLEMRAARGESSLPGGSLGL